MLRAPFPRPYNDVMADSNNEETYPLVFPVIKRLFQLYSAARKTEIADRAVREGVKQRYVILKECMKGFFPAAAVDMDSSTKESCLRELATRGLLLQQRFRIHFYFQMRGRTGGGEAVFIKREYFDSLERWLSKTGLSPKANESDPTTEPDVSRSTDETQAGRGDVRRADIDAYFAAAEENCAWNFNSAGRS
jgi:hypothetical protein